MATMIDNETNRYLCNETITDTALLDDAAAKDSDFLNGEVTGDGVERNFDGASSAIGFTNGAGVTPWVWSNAGGSAGYIKYKNQEDTTGQNGVLSITAGAGTGSGPYVFWDDVNVVNGIRFSINIAQGSYYQNFLLGREMNVDETFVIAWSWDKTTRDYIYVLKSDDSVDPIDQNKSGTGVATIPLDNASWYFGGNSVLSLFGANKLNQFGVVVGTQYLLSELQADVDTLLLPPSTSTTSPIISPIYPSKIMDNIMTRDLYKKS